MNRDLQEKILANEDRLNSLIRKKENLEVEIENLQLKIKNQKRALQGTK